MPHAAPAAAAPAPPVPTTPLWRLRDYNLIMTGRTLAVIGSGMSGLAIMLTAMDLSHDAAVASAVMSASLVGMALLSLPAGALVDRWDRKRVMVITSLVQGAALATIPAAMAAGALTVWHLGVVAFLTGALGTFYGPAETASLKRVVAAPQLGTAFAVNQARQSFGSVVGPPLAGALYGISRSLPFVGDAAANLVAGLLAAFVRTDLRPTPDDVAPARRHLLAEIRDGLSFVFRHTTLRTVALAACLANLGLNASFTSVLLDLQRRGTAPPLIGLIETVSGACGLVGAVAAPALLRRFSVGTLTVALMGLAALAVWLCVPFSAAWHIMVILGGLMLVIPAANAGIMAYFTHLVPDALQGRAGASVGLLSMGMTPLGTLAAGLLLQHAGRTAALLPGVVCLAAVAALALLSPHIRAIPRTSDFAPDEAGPRSTAA